HKQALAMWRRLYPEARYPAGHPHLAQSLHNLGSALQDQGAHAEAADYFKQALAMRRKLYPAGRYPAGHPDLALSLNNLGGALHAQGAYGEARQACDEAAQAMRTDPRPVDLDRGADTAKLLKPLPTTALVVRNRAWALERSLPARPAAADLRRAERAYALAAALHDRLRTEALRRDRDKVQHGETADLLLPRRVGLLARLLDLEGDPDDLAAAFGAVEHGRARLFLESLGEAHAARLAELPDDLRKQESRLSLRLRELDARIARLQ